MTLKIIQKQMNEEQLEALKRDVMDILFSTIHPIKSIAVSELYDRVSHLCTVTDYHDTLWSLRSDRLVWFPSNSKFHDKLELIPN